MRKALLAALLMSLTSASASAMTAQHFLDHLKNDVERELLRFHIWGIGDGFLWANAFQQTKGGKPLYCPPDRLVLKVDNLVQIVQSQVKERPQEADLELGLVLGAGLMRTFPCNEGG